jgi:fumarate hydratase subunit alpha
MYHKELVKNKILKSLIEISYTLSSDIEEFLNYSLQNETQVKGKHVLNAICENLSIAKKNKIPMCQDTGLFWFLVRMGEKCVLDFSINEIINEASNLAFKQGYLRASMVKDPILRENTGNNLPPVIQYEIVPGDKLEVWVTAKGFGSENSGASWFFRPTDSKEKIIQTIVDRVLEVGSSACPPVFVGVGIGGTLDYAALLSKKALFRKVGLFSPETHIENMEKSIFEKITNSKMGPGGVGGDFSVFHVAIESSPTHIAGLPVVLSIGCWANRKKIMRFE